MNTLYMRKKLTLISGLALIITMIGCTKREVVKNLPPTPKPMIEKTFPEISLFEDNKKLTKLAETCASSEIGTQSNYGKWQLTKDCELTVSTSPEKSITISAFHTNNKGDIDALQAITVEAEKLKLLRQRYPSGVHRIGNTCVRHGYSSLPILTIVKRNLCSELTYNLL